MCMHFSTSVVNYVARWRDIPRKNATYLVIVAYVQFCYRLVIFTCVLNDDKNLDTQHIFNFSHCEKMKPICTWYDSSYPALMTSFRVGEQKRSRGGGDIKFLSRHPTLLNRQQSSAVSHDVSPLYFTASEHGPCAINMKRARLRIHKMTRQDV